MRSWMMLMLGAGLAAGCGDKDTETTDSGDINGGDSGDTDTDVEPLSDYASGQYRIGTLELVSDLTEGADVDGDGEIDNKLPTVLNLAATITGEPLDITSLNKVLAADIADGDLILLTELAHAEAVLTFDALLGIDDKGSLSVDPTSYASDGTPNSRFSGAFTSQTDFSATSERIELPFPIIIGEPAIQVPMELAVVSGAVDAKANSGLIGGAVPVDDFMTQVIEEIIPTGDDYNPEAYLDMTRKELMDFIYEFATGETVADIELEDGRKAISAAVRYEAAAASF